MAEVVMFTRPNCRFCEMAKELLMSKMREDKFKQMNVNLIVLDEQPNYEVIRKEMIRLSDGQTTVPQIFIQGEHVLGGYTALKRLDVEGTLNCMLDTSAPVLNSETNPHGMVLFEIQGIKTRPLSCIVADDFTNSDF